MNFETPPILKYLKLSFREKELKIFVNNSKFFGVK
jgi:hypothetical protein